MFYFVQPYFSYTIQVNQWSQCKWRVTSHKRLHRMNQKREKRVSTRASERDRNMERYLPICITLVNRFSILMWVSEAMAINNEKLFVAHLDFLIYCPFLPTHRHTKAQRQRARQVVKYTSNSDFIEQPQQTAFHVFLSLGRIWLVHILPYCVWKRVFFALFVRLLLLFLFCVHTILKYIDYSVIMSFVCT